MRPEDVRDLLGRPGSSRLLVRSDPVEGLETGLAEVPADRPVTIDLLLESLVEGILVTGEVRGIMALRCARCLTELERPFAERVQVLYAREADPDADEYELSPQGEVDLEPMVRDAVVLTMPFSPLCRPDCRGLCEKCGGNRNRGECACSEAPADPRWAGLERLLE